MISYVELRSLEKQEEILVNLYPNPTQNSVNINFSKPQTNVIIEVINVLGQSISSKKYSNIKETNINIKGATGIYFIKIKGDDLSFTQKIIKN